MFNFTLLISMIVQMNEVLASKSIVLIIFIYVI